LWIRICTTHLFTDWTMVRNVLFYDADINRAK
jgi:hypothetical protein